MDEDNVVYPHNEYYSAFEKEEILPCGTTQMNLGIMLSAVGQIQDEYCILHLYEESEISNSHVHKTKD